MAAHHSGMSFLVYRTMCRRFLCLFVPNFEVASHQKYGPNGNCPGIGCGVVWEITP